MNVLVTGGAGFIGSAIVRKLLAIGGINVAAYDCITYAANRATLAPFRGNSHFRHIECDICCSGDAVRAFHTFEPDVIIHLAAETHVDRSIENPGAFVQTNVLGTFVMLEAALNYWRKTKRERVGSFLFHHVSTDEVFGSLGPEGLFSETSLYDPRSPYAASKAASDHFVRAYNHTFGLPTVITNCSNNYGFFQFPEKLIPLMILRAVSLQPMPVYGNGENVRDWLFVDDHAEAIWRVAQKGIPGSTYTIGGNSERSNIDVARLIAELVDEMCPPSRTRPSLIRFVEDRPGHDRRYAIDASKIRRELGWEPCLSFEEGLRKTVRWYLDNEAWWQPIIEQRHALIRRGMR